MKKYLIIAAILILVYFWYSSRSAKSLVQKSAPIKIGKPTTLVPHTIGQVIPDKSPSTIGSSFGGSINSDLTGGAVPSLEEGVLIPTIDQPAVITIPAKETPVLGGSILSALTFE